MSILRELIDEDLFRSEPARALYDAALLVRRAGLEHLVTEATRAEVLALTQAGADLDRDRAMVLVETLRRPEKAAAMFDNGNALRDLAIDSAMAIARKGG